MANNERDKTPRRDSDEITPPMGKYLIPALLVVLVLAGGGMFYTFCQNKTLLPEPKPKKADQYENYLACLNQRLDSTQMGAEDSAKNRIVDFVQIKKILIDSVFIIERRSREESQNLTDLDNLIKQSNADLDSLAQQYHIQLPACPR